MPLRNTQLEYGTAAKWLHWLVAFGIFALMFLGLLQSDMDSGPERTAIRELHGSIAMLLLVLMTLRLIWRWVNETPGHPEGVPGWQRASAALVHLAIYIAVFVQLVSGALAVATGGKPIVPRIPGAEHGIVSDDFFELEDRPQRVLVAGSGYIAVELAADKEETNGILRDLGLPLLSVKTKALDNKNL